MGWQIALFRFGLFACLVLAIVVATQFDITDSVVSIWNQTPTAHAAQVAAKGAAARQASCLSAQARSPKSEYPSSCYANDPVLRGMPSDQARANVKGFLIALIPLLILLLAVVWFGIRMARRSRVD